MIFWAISWVSHLLSASWVWKTFIFPFSSKTSIFDLLIEPKYFVFVPYRTEIWLADYFADQSTDLDCIGAGVTEDGRVCFPPALLIASQLQHPVSCPNIVYIRLIISISIKGKSLQFSPLIIEYFKTYQSISILYSRDV